LGDWAGNITDLLSDERYDDYDFNELDHRVILARYYTRIMMVILEHLADLQKMVEVMLDREGGPARRLISPPDDKNWVYNFHCFVNSVCKHKAGKNGIHSCNHHLPLHFADMLNTCQLDNPVNLSNFNLSELRPNVIQYPKIELLIDRVLTAYKRVDSIVMENEAGFDKICTKYNDPNYIWTP
jgi:hypothetical protein